MSLPLNVNASIYPIRYMIEDNEVGATVAFCYTEEQALKIIEGLYRCNEINEQDFFEQNDYYRFTYTDLRNYAYDGHMALSLVAGMAAGFFGEESKIKKI